MRSLLRGVAGLLSFYVDCIRAICRLALPLAATKETEEDVCPK
jgi:hypothetical protein